MRWEGGTLKTKNLTTMPFVLPPLFLTLWIDQTKILQNHRIIVADYEYSEGLIDTFDNEVLCAFPCQTKMLVRGPDRASPIGASHVTNNVLESEPRVSTAI